MPKEAESCPAWSSDNETIRAPGCARPAVDVPTGRSKDHEFDRGEFVAGQLRKRPGRRVGNLRRPIPATLATETWVIVLLLASLH